MSEKSGVAQGHRGREAERLGEGRVKPRGGGRGMRDRPQAGEAAGSVGLAANGPRPRGPGLRKGAGSSVQSGPSAEEEVGGSREDGGKGVLGKMKTHFFWR